MIGKYNALCSIFCQAQFQLASSVPVQLGTEISLIISVTPPHPTHPLFVLILYVFQANRLGGHYVTFVCITGLFRQ